jgi:Fanconi-associated nuclease 1
MSEINHRLMEIENGIAAELIQKVWQEHFKRETCVVGLDWSFEYHDLQEIARLFDGQTLAIICKVLAQDYGSRCGGMPDLFLWHPERKEIKFSEVKSENDRLSDTQRLWIDVLTSAGVKVELCHAVAKEIIG